eukprot:CAMPEP_0205867454 /NCGR_PEP_ID=MMETSP1083-20121108/8967_1 /ASSEMBLY_ACC=CAM_ASM_000430 /TAXON_ID=97485 /ORGANISM="Prymnesium parvum, Strain Texoma1" /LENGTH=46 /DNA_ID= /DNA_START= /DNA_END= /DNA_ORIENTATION=
MEKIKKGHLHVSDGSSLTHGRCNRLITISRDAVSGGPSEAFVMDDH